MGCEEDPCVCPAESAESEEPLKPEQVIAEQVRSLQSRIGKTWREYRQDLIKADMIIKTMQDLNKADIADLNRRQSEIRKLEAEAKKLGGSVTPKDFLADFEKRITFIAADTKLHPLDKKFVIGRWKALRDDFIKNFPSQPFGLGNKSLSGTRRRLEHHPRFIKLCEEIARSLLSC